MTPRPRALQAPIDWDSVTVWARNSAGLARLRAAALHELAAGLHCQSQAERWPSGDIAVRIGGPTAVVAWLRAHGEVLLAELDLAARAATRRYGAWLRGQDEPDHEPAWRRSLMRAYRRSYMQTWPAAYLQRLWAIGDGRDQPTAADNTEPWHHHSHQVAADHDVAHLDAEDLTALAAARTGRTAVPDPRPGPVTADRPAVPASAAVPERVDGPGRIGPGQRVTCLPGSLPRSQGGRGTGRLISVGPKTSRVDVSGDRERRIPNELLHPHAGPWVAAEQRTHGVPTTYAHGREWLPKWAWLDWTIAEHVAYNAGQLSLPTPSPAPTRLVIIACGKRKSGRYEDPAGQMYTGSYHTAARRAADAIADEGTRILIISAQYGLMDLTDRILCYEQRLGARGSITAGWLGEQAEQLGVLATQDVTILAPAAYAALLTTVWPHAKVPLAGSRGIGDHLARYAALATGRATVADLLTGQDQPVQTTSTPTPPDDPTGTGTGAEPRSQPAMRGRSTWPVSTKRSPNCTSCSTVGMRSTRRSFGRSPTAAPLPAIRHRTGVPSPPAYANALTSPTSSPHRRRAAANGQPLTIARAGGEGRA